MFTAIKINVRGFFMVKNIYIRFLLLCFAFVFTSSVSFAQVSWNGGGDGVNWSSAGNWSTGIVPTNSQTVTIPSGYTAVTVDMAAVCASLILGNGGNSNTTLTISGTNSLNITTAGGGAGNLSFNPNNNPKVYSLIVGGGTVTVAGTLTSGNAGKKGGVITVSTGSVSFTSVTAFTFPKGLDLTITATGSISFVASITLGAASAVEASSMTLQGSGSYTFSGLVTISDADHIIQNNTAAGTFNFNGGLTMSAGGSSSFVTMAGTTVNFGGNLNISGSALVFDPASTAVITGTSTLTPTAAITFGDFRISGGAATLAGNITVVGDWTNNGGTLASGGFTVTFLGSGKVIGGTSLSAFGPVIIGSASVYTMNNNNSCSSLTFTSSAANSSLTHSGASALTVSGTVTINQPSAAVTTSWNINSGSSTVAGILSFVGGSATANTIGKIGITSGSLIANGSVNFASNNTDANQLIAVAGAGSATFNSTVITTGQTDLRDGTLSADGGGSMTFTQFMDMRGGTISVGATGTVNFNKTGATAFSLTNTSVPVFTTNSGSIINFNGNLTIVSPALVLANGSNSNFTAASTITPTSALTFGNITINAAVTATLAGNISVTGDWINLSGTLTPGTNTVSFTGTGTQTITKAGATETFYGLTVNTIGPLTLASTTDVNITNTLTMTAGNINLNGKTLQLGVGALATLVRTAGIMYSNTGTFKRYVQSGTALSSTAAPLYGLFPVGSSTDYRPVQINSSASPTASGYISVIHYDPPPPSYVVDVSYTDNEGAAIQRISTIVAKVSTSVALGGTYSVSVTYSNLSSQGILTDLKLETYTGAVMGSVGTTFATGGSVGAPVGNRSGVSGAELVNDFVIGTKDKSPTGTPIRQYYYSRKNGNWNDNTVGNGTWSYSSGGAGASCNCIPVNDGYAVVSDGQTVTVNVASTVDYVDIGNTSTLDGTATMTINKDIRTIGSGKFSPTAGSWTITRDVFLVGTGNSSLTAASTVTGDLNIGTGTILTMSGGAGLTVTGNMVVAGTLALGTSTLTFNGTAGKTISNTTAGTITGVAATVNITTANKTISAGTSLTIASTFAISGAITVTNSGTVTITGNITGSVGGSTWTNAANSVLNTTATILATGTLNASAGPNTVNYNAVGAQTIKAPASSYYNLTCSVSGTKSMGASVAATNNVTIQGSVILDEAVAAYNLSGAAALTMTGTSEFIVRNSTTALTMPELTGAYNLTGGTVTINSNPGNGAKSTTVRGATYYNLNLIGNNEHKILGVLTITNNFTVTGSTYFNDNVALTVGGATLYSSSVSTTLAGNLTTGTYTITSGTFNDGGNTITVTGLGWTKNGGTFTSAGTGNVSFTGTAAQTIGGSSSTSFNNLTINNSSATGVTLAQPIIVLGTGILTLTSGFLYTDATNLITMNSGSSVSGVSNNSFVLGPLAKVGSTNFTFPVGKLLKYRPIAITSLSGSDTFTAEYFLTDPNPLYSVASKDATLDHISRSEYWILNRAGVRNAFVTLSWDSYSGGVDDIANLKVARWDGAVWRDHSNGGTTGGPDPATGTVITSALVTSFSPFTLSSNNGNNPLPVEFLTFTATPDGKNVDMDWSTAVEMNSDYFMVQRSQDGNVFEDVVSIKAAGNSSTLKKYSSVDTDPYSGVSYYRLKQFDLDGKFYYSDIIAVNIFLQGELSIYPNPSNGPFNLSITGVQGEKTLIVIRDMLGKEFYSNVIILTNDSETLAIDPSGKLSAGIYMVIASSDDAILEKKLIIK